jgi:hypothetical protein
VKSLVQELRIGLIRYQDLAGDFHR